MHGSKARGRTPLLAAARRRPAAMHTRLTLIAVLLVLLVAAATIISAAVQLGNAHHAARALAGRRRLAAACTRCGAAANGDARACCSRASVWRLAAHDHTAPGRLAPAAAAAAAAALALAAGQPCCRCCCRGRHGCHWRAPVHDGGNARGQNGTQLVRRHARRPRHLLHTERHVGAAVLLRNHTLQHAGQQVGLLLRQRRAGTQQAARALAAATRGSSKRAEHPSRLQGSSPGLLLLLSCVVLLHHHLLLWLHHLLLLAAATQAERDAGLRLQAGSPWRAHHAQLPQLPQLPAATGTREAAELCRQHHARWARQQRPALHLAQRLLQQQVLLRAGQACKRRHVVQQGVHKRRVLRGAGARRLLLHARQRCQLLLLLLLQARLLQLLLLLLLLLLGGSHRCMRVAQALWHAQHLLLLLLLLLGHEGRSRRARRPLHQARLHLDLVGRCAAVAAAAAAAARCCCRRRCLLAAVGAGRVILPLAGCSALLSSGGQRASAGCSVVSEGAAQRRARATALPPHAQIGNMRAHCCHCQRPCHRSSLHCSGRLWAGTALPAVLHARPSTHLGTARCTPQPAAV
jgi:hypothetical protein